MIDTQRTTATKTLRSFYRFVAVGTVSTLGLIAALDVLAIICRYDNTEAIESWPPPILLLPAVICSSLAIGNIVLWLGMIFDCAFTSKMPTRSKVIWLALLIFTSSIGALIYYFCFYKGPSNTEGPCEVNPPARA
jgi:Phospholipase_D-nuclease N-terminal